MKYIDLCGKWNGNGFDEKNENYIEFEGTVPGCVHTDLLDAKVINDIFWRDNAETVQWIERYNWSYKKEFELDLVEDNAKLVFEGLDTYCDIYLNEHHVGNCDNMFISYDFDVDSYLKKGKNIIEIVFYSPVLQTLGKKKRSGAFTTERLYTRRMQCTYGWDWVNRFVTCGICKDVYLTFGNQMKVSDTYIYTSNVDDNSAQIVIEASLENYTDGGLVDFEIISPDNEKIYSKKMYCEEKDIKSYIDIKSPKLWYPNGYGDQPLYQVKISVGDEVYEQTFGIRTIKILQMTDEKGSEYYNKCLELKKSSSAQEYDFNEDFSGFILLINNEMIMCKGGNWVPCEPFVSAEKNEKITHLLTLAKEANVNMIRVWGGGVFEKQHFYNECDRLGILVTQDFLMACGSYPEDEEWFVESLKKEAAYAAKKLRNHPCLAWWSGDNENAILGDDEKKDYSGRISALHGIAPVLKELDSQRVFLPSSPYGGNQYASKTKGTTHNTQFLTHLFDYIESEDLCDYKNYFKEYLARFVAEEPALGAVSLPTMKKIMTEEDIYDTNDMWLYHTKTNPGLKLEIFDCLLLLTEKLFGKFKDGHDKYFKLKYTQFEWIRITLENFRRSKWFCSGIIYWMLDDCWPAAAGWALIDYYGLPKAAYYSFKRCAKDVIASIDQSGSKYIAYVCNDSLIECCVEVRLFAMNRISGEITFEINKTIVVPKNVSVKAIETEIKTDNYSIVICEVKHENGFDRAFYVDGVLKITKCDEFEVVSKSDNSITIAANKYIHAVELDGEYIFGDNYFSMLPNETKCISFRKMPNMSDDYLGVCGVSIE